MLNRKNIITFFTFLLTTHTALALNLQSYQFSDSYRYSLLEDSLQEKFPGKYVFTGSLAHVNSPLYYSDTYLHDRGNDIINSNQVLTFGFSYYLSDRMSVGLDVSGVHNKVFGDSHTTFGDTILKSRFNLLHKNTWSLSLNPKVYLPTGDKENFSSMGSVGGSLSLVAEKSLNRLHLLASVGGLSSKDNVYVDVDHRQMLLTQLGVSYDFTDRFNLNLESYRNFPLVKDNYQDEGKYFLTGKHKTHDRFSTYFGAGLSGWGDLQRDSYSAFVGIKFHEKAVAPVTAMVKQRQVYIPKESIYFGHNESEISSRENEKLHDYAQFMHDQGNSIKSVVIEGYASRPGSNEYNMKLSEKRAQAVRSYMIQQGFPENIFSIKAFGEDFVHDPLESNNRKVMFKIK